MASLSPTPPPPPPPSLLALFLLCHASLLLAVAGLNSDGTALLSFRAAVSRDPTGSLADWNSSHLDPCSWNGIACKEGSVVSLSLPKKRLVGYIPSALGSLPSLRHVNLRSNRLFGRLPVGLFAARGLQSLVLSGNFLSGSVPPEIGELLYLQNLDLSRNLLSGSIPATLVQCKRLKTLVLSHNNCTDSLPLGLGANLLGLERLDLSYNRLNGSIPSDIGNLTNLQGTLDLSHNQFSGLIPPGLGNLPEKVYIDLSYNDLSGPIPQDGSLENRGPAAFTGNAELCGRPLNNSCSSDAQSSQNGTPSSGSSRPKGLGSVAVTSIVVADVVGICLIALLFFYLYRKAIVSLEAKKDVRKSAKRWKSRKVCMCFRKEELDSSSDDAAQYVLVPLDKHLSFDLNGLLKATAFVLGKSEIGIVYKVVLDDGLTLAVRRLGEGGLQRFKEFQTEVEAIGEVKHPNIVPLRAYYWSIDEKLLIYDHIPNGNLSDAIHEKDGIMNFVPLSWEIRLRIMKGIAKGLTFLHEFSPKKYVHGDLKPTNILLGLNMEPYISDFGVGRLASIAEGSPFLQSSRMPKEKVQGQRQPYIGFSPIISKGSLYQAPEMLNTLKPSQKWDVYSYGVILLEMISGKSPLALLETTEMDLVHWIQFCIQEKRSLLDMLDPVLAHESSRQDEIIVVIKLALSCVHGNPEKRPSMRHVADTMESL